jgi:endonuclease/exonuclease/phosphatase family metal-dependent hydrolase
MSRRLLSLAGCLLALLVLASTASAAAKKPDLTVMSRNLYLGADIIKLVGAPDLAGEEQQVNALYETVQATNYPERVKRLAQEIADNKPDLIGLQEVSRYYRTPEGAATDAPATVVLYDWMALLQAQLKQLKQPYKVVQEQTELDITTPSAAGYGLRLKLGNAVMVRTGKGAKVGKVKGLSGEFTDQLHVSIPSGPVDLHRGYAGLDGVVAGKKFRFLAPHAEAYSAAAANGQFKQLLAGPAKSKKLPTIIAGDFNSDPADPGDDNAYNTVIGAGYVDTGKRAATCCQNETVNNPVSELKTWIDHIVVRPRAKVLRTHVFGNQVSDMISGLWPSDHAGVVATIRLR